MTTLNKVKPSLESTMQLNRPITVISRNISAHSVVDKHSHNWGQLVYASKGVLLVVTDKDRFIVPPEQGVWLLPKVEHEVTAITDAKLTSFYFSCDLLPQLPNINSVLRINTFLKALILEANNISQAALYSRSDDLLLKLILARLSLAPNEIFQLPYPKDSRLRTMLTLIQHVPSNNDTLADWGNIVGASARTLSRLFKNETGLSYRTWRQRLTIQIAISKLSSGMSVSSISLYLGYESPSAFIHMFKENTGMTPNYYRNKA
jgi:AraC-like DNA-binding protein